MAGINQANRDTPLGIGGTERDARVGAGADALVASQVLAAQYSWLFLVSQSFIPAVNVVLLGSLLYQSRLVPRALPVLGFVGATLLTAAWLATLFGFIGATSAPAAIAGLTIAAWEFSLGVYLVVKGFKPLRSQQAWRTSSPLRCAL